MNLNQEMQTAYGTVPTAKCRECIQYEKGKCILTNQKHSCLPYAAACGRFLRGAERRSTAP